VKAQLTGARQFGACEAVAKHLFKFTLVVVVSVASRVVCASHIYNNIQILQFSIERRNRLKR
jgi:hypothetical protein